MFLDRTTNIVKISVLPNLIYGFNAVLTKTPESNSVHIRKPITKFIQRGKNTPASPIRY